MDTNLTDAASTSIVIRRSIPASARTDIADSGDIVQNTEAEHIQLTKTSEVEAEEHVTVVAPKAFTLTRDDGSIKEYQAGTQEMPVSDAAHWFTRALGVKVYNGAKD